MQYRPALLLTELRINITYSQHICDLSIVFPNIYTVHKYTVLQLLLSLPVGSCCCERSFSAFWSWRLSPRTTTLEDRLNGLALAYAHRDIDVDWASVLQNWGGSGHRRINLAFPSTNNRDD